VARRSRPQVQAGEGDDEGDAMRGEREEG